MKFHIITAVTRPNNLKFLLDSILLSSFVADIEIAWHWKFNIEKNDIGGHRTKNEILNTIPICNDFVWFLDDDNLVHPNFFLELKKYIVEGTSAVVVALDRQDGRISQAVPENIKMGSIDTHQAIIRRNLIGATRIPEVFGGDGMFYEALLKGNKTVLFINKPLVWHNAITGEDVHE